MVFFWIYFVKFSENNVKLFLWNFMLINIHQNLYVVSSFFGLSGTLSENKGLFEPLRLGNR